MKKHRIYKPKNDDRFFEQVSNIIFIIGFNYRIVQQHWPKIKKAFSNFSVEKVADYWQKDIDRLLKADGMIKNRRKISFIIHNAKICVNLKKQHGSVLKWIEKLKKERKKDKLFAPTLAESFRMFKGIGETTSGWLENIHNAKGTYLEYTMDE